MKKDLSAIYNQSIENPEEFWGEVAKDVFDPPQAKPVPQAAIDFLIQTGELDQFIAKYKGQNLPRQGVPKRPAVNDFEIRAWDNLWGRYYNADGTLK